MILAGKTVIVHLADGTSHTVDISIRDEMRFEQHHKVSLPKVLTDSGYTVPAWVTAGIVHWRLLRSDIEGVPQDFEEFVDSLSPDIWIEEADEGKAEGSALAPPTG